MKKPDRYPRAGDFVVLAAALALFALSALLLWRPATPGDTVTISASGAVWGVYPLGTDRVVELPGNTVVIEDGAVYMRDADCPDGICVAQGRLNGAGLIVCLPNRVVVRVDASGGYDAVVGRKVTP